MEIIYILLSTALIHALITRFNKKPYKNIFILVFIGWIFIGFNYYSDVRKLIYFLVTYTLGMYCYFQLLNMSQTARRIKFLSIASHAGGKIRISEIINSYSGMDVIKLRLGRLYASGLINENFSPKKGFKLLIFKFINSVIEIFKTLFNYSPNNFKSIPITFSLVFILMVGIFNITNYGDFRIYSQQEINLDANVYLGAKNFAERGLIQSNLMPDYAVGDDSNHPLYYSHFPAFGEIFTSLLYKVGINKIIYLKIVALIFSLIGMLYWFKLIKIYFNLSIANMSCLALLTSQVYLFWIDSLWSHYWFFIFAFLYYYIKIVSNNKSLNKKCFTISILCLMISSSWNLETIPFLTTFIIILPFIYKYNKKTKIFLIYFSSILVPIIIKYAFQIKALGLAVVIKDIKFIFLKRIIGVSNVELFDFYKSQPIVLWDTDLHRISFPENYFTEYISHISHDYGIALFPSIIVTILVTYKNKDYFYKYITFIIASMSWSIIAKTHAWAHLNGSTSRFYDYLSALTIGVLIFGISKYCLVSNISFSKDYESFFLKVRLEFLQSKKFIISILIYFLVSILILSRLSLFQFPQKFVGLDILRGYKGVLIESNLTPSLVSYFTDAPASFSPNNEINAKISSYLECIGGSSEKTESSSCSKIHLGEHNFFVHPRVRNNLRPSFYFFCELGNANSMAFNALRSAFKLVESSYQRPGDNCFLFDYHKTLEDY